MSGSHPLFPKLILHIFFNSNWRNVRHKCTLGLALCGLTFCPGISLLCGCTHFPNHVAALIHPIDLLKREIPSKLAFYQFVANLRTFCVPVLPPKNPFSPTLPQPCHYSLTLIHHSTLNRFKIAIVQPNFRSHMVIFISHQRAVARRFELLAKCP